MRFDTSRLLLALLSVVVCSCRAEGWELLDRSAQLDAQRSNAVLWFEAGSFSSPGSAKVAKWPNLGTAAGAAHVPTSAPELAAADWPSVGWSGLRFAEKDVMNIDPIILDFDRGATLFSLFRPSDAPRVNPAWVYCFGEGQTEFSLRISPDGLDTEIAGHGGLAGGSLQKNDIYLTSARVTPDGEYVFRINGQVVDSVSRGALEKQSVERYSRQLGGGFTGDIGFVAVYEQPLSDSAIREVERTISARYGCCTEPASRCCVE